MTKSRPPIGVSGSGCRYLKRQSSSGKNTFTVPDTGLASVQEWSSSDAEALAAELDAHPRRDQGWWPRADRSSRKAKRRSHSNNLSETAARAACCSKLNRSDMKGSPCSVVPRPAKCGGLRPSGRLKRTWMGRCRRVQNLLPAFHAEKASMALRETRSNVHTVQKRPLHCRLGLTPSKANATNTRQLLILAAAMVRETQRSQMSLDTIPQMPH